MVALALPRPNLSLPAFSFSITDMKSGPLADIVHGLAGRRAPNSIGLRAVNGKRVARAERAWPSGGEFIGCQKSVLCR
jgi:hypothetical protein